MGSSSRSLASKPSSSASSKQIRPFFLFLIILLFLSLLFLTLSLKPNPKLITTPKLLHMENKNPLAAHHVWFDVVARAFKSRRKMKIGMVNMMDEELHGLPNTETVKVGFDRMTDDRMRSWKEYFPEWIDEDKKWRTPKCPEIPLVRRVGDYGDVDVVVARVPCGNGTEKEGIRDVFRLQVNLVVAQVAVESGWVTSDRRREMYVVFVGDCGPMLELFRCDDLVLQRGEFWVYKPDVAGLKHKLLMPVGTCQIAPPFSQTGKEPWRYYMSSQSTPQKHDNVTHRQRPRYAYATVLHSSEAYVCGAISLARSIRLTNSTKDLLLLADESITSNTTRALRLAGWKIRRIHRIRSPFSQKGSYNEWNYSKLRVWQLTDYEKVIFIDADLLVLKNIDHFFTYPQLSASSNNKVLFNSGLMVVEPSACLFEDLMRKSFRLESYNGGDQGFLNEAFTWWHKLPSKLNYLKNFNSGKHDDVRDVRDDVYAMHYLGFKPWMCYRDYDCNWDRLDHHVFASDSANQRWWKVYDTIPMELKPYCGLTRRMSWRIKNRRQRAMSHNLSDGHWRIHIKDPRQFHYVD